MTPDHAKSLIAQVFCSLYSHTTRADENLFQELSFAFVDLLIKESQEAREAAIRECIGVRSAEPYYITSSADLFEGRLWALLEKKE